MEKRMKIILLVVLLGFLTVGGYFLADSFGILPNGKVSYVKPQISEIISDENMNNIEIVAQDEIIGSEVDEKIEEKEIVPKDEQHVVERKEVIIEKKVAEKKDESAEDTDGEVGKITDKLMSGGFQKSSGRKIDTIIVHTSYNAIGEDKYDINDIIKQYEQYNVSAHYLISRDGAIYRLVKDENIAWHAGVSKMPDGRTNINDFSIGIEVVNTKEGKFSDAEYEALNSLIVSLKKKYSIKNILGHDDIAPGRKTDPWGIEWNRVNR